jgi:citrate synthase
MSGLEGVEVGTTRLSQVDGAAGRLWIGGYPVEELAGRVSFEQVLGLLWDGELPEGAAAETWRQDLSEARVRVAPGVAGPGLPHPMDELRARLAGLTPAPDPRRAYLEAVAAVAVAVGALARRRSGVSEVTPDPTRGHAEDLLRLVRGEPGSPGEVAALEAYLVTVVDHGMNASTFTARVVASTGSDLVSCVVAAVGALKGPLHGGAPGPVLDMLDACAVSGDPEAWLRGELEAGRRIMGMGHRVYRVRDPRAAALEGVFSLLAGEGGGGRLELAREVEARARELLALRHPTRPLEANVEFYTAILLEALGLGRELFSPVFAAARVGGWGAHVREQSESGRLLRPRVGYHGPHRHLPPPSKPAPRAAPPAS